MKFYSTKDRNKKYSLKEAVLKGLPDDNGLFMPENIPLLKSDFFDRLQSMSIPESAFEIVSPFMNDIPEDVLSKICSEAFNFLVPLKELDQNTFVAELYHGPTLAFKDFGARFMARVMSYLNRDETKKLTILVATSGDTGGAVADGFFGVEGIEVVILYPSGGVSDLQEKQLTTYGDNIHALEIHGTFDDCQALVKTAFLDKELSTHYRLSSANSINICRLIPQCIYYFEAYRQLENKKNEIRFSVPSGNFGNLTAGLIAKRMGLPVNFIASTNINDVVPHYFYTGDFTPRKSMATISNAMDVGNPSNFGRMMDLYNNLQKGLKQDVAAFAFTDEETKDVMRKVHASKKYILDPHGAVAYAAWEKWRSGKDTTGIIMETAHPSKFLEVVEDTLGIKLPLPPSLEKLREKTKVAMLLSNSFSEFKTYMLNLEK
jgi:threonine synthase